MLKEKVRDMIQRLKGMLQANKKLIIIAISTGIAVMVLILNIHLIQMGYYVAREDTIKITEILKRDTAKVHRQDDWYFEKGMEQILVELTDETKIFLEEQFGSFIPSIQQEIIKRYNRDNLTFKKNKAVFEAIIVDENPQVYKDYMHNLPIEAIEDGLRMCFGDAPKLTQDVVDQIYKIVSLQQKKLVLEKFKISPYELMMFPHNGDINSISLKLLDSIEAESVKEHLFQALKTSPIEIEVFETWVDILNKKKIISTTEYAAFTNSYGNIRRMQEQYKQVLLQEVDLKNIKQMTDVQTEEITNQIDKLSKEAEALAIQKETDSAELWELSNYKEMNLYVLDQYQNGDYEVAVPQQSWLFGTYKPSSERIRLKVTNTFIDSQGVKLFKVYNKGTSSDGLPYYEEVSAEHIARIQELDALVKQADTTLKNYEEQIAQLEQEVEQIRTLNNYEQTLLLLEEVEGKKVDLELEVKKEKVNIQNLFEIGELIVDIQDK